MVDVLPEPDERLQDRPVGRREGAPFDIETCAGALIFRSPARTIGAKMVN
jgi:hypothetical protein